MPQPTNQSADSRVCQKCGYNMGENDECCLRCVLLGPEDSPITPSPTTTTGSSSDQSVASMLKDVIPSPSVAPNTQPNAVPARQAPAIAPFNSAPPPYTQTRPSDSRYSNSGGARNTPPVRPTAVTVISVLMFIGALFTIITIVFEKSTSGIVSGIICIVYYSTIGWALISLQPWGRKTAIIAMISVFCITRFLDFSSIKQQQEQQLKAFQTKMQQQFPSSMSGNGMPDNSTVGGNQVSPVPPIHPVPGMTPMNPASNPGNNSPTATPYPSNHIPNNFPTQPASPNPPSNYADLMGKAVYIGFVLGSIVAAIINVIYIIFLNKPEVLEAFGE